MSVIYTICQLGNVKNETFVSCENSFKNLEDAKKFCEKGFKNKTGIYSGNKKAYKEDYLNEFFGGTGNYFEESGLVYFILQHVWDNINNERAEIFGYAVYKRKLK